MKKETKRNVYPWVMCGLLLVNHLTVPFSVLADETNDIGDSSVTDEQILVPEEEQMPEIGYYSLTQLKVSASTSSVYAGENAVFSLHYQNAVTNEAEVGQNKILILTLDGFSKSSIEKIDVNQLQIEGIIPVLHDRQLIYEVGSLKRGATLIANLAFPTENGVSPTGMKASVTAEMKNSVTGESVISTSSEITIISASSLAVSTKYGETIGSSEAIVAPRVGDETLWEFNISFPKQASGVKYLNENDPLIITYVLDGDATFKEVIGETPEPTFVSDDRKELRWEITNPTILEQEQATEELFAKQFRLNIQIDEDAIVFSKLTGTVSASASFIDGSYDSKSYEATVSITRDEKTDPPSLEGAIYGAYWYGPTDGKGTTNKATADANPTVYPDALLGWKMINGVGHALHIYHEVDFLSLDFEFDGNQDFKQFYANPAVYQPGIEAGEALTTQPVFDMIVTFDDQSTVTLIENVQPSKMYDLTKEPYANKIAGKTIQRVTLSYSKVPKGLLNSPGLLLYTTPKKGYTGEVSIKASMRVKGVGNSVGQGYVDFTYSEDGIYDNEEEEIHPHSSEVWKNIMSKRSANVIEYGKDEPRIFSQNIQVNKNNQVKPGENEVTVTLTNLKDSLARINGKFESYILLPHGITFLDGDSKGVKIKEIAPRFGGKNQSLIKVTYEGDGLGVAKNLSAKFKVRGEKDLLTSGKILLYTMIDTEEDVSVPETITEVPFDLATTITKDINDLNNNGKTDERLYASARSISYAGNHSFSIDLDSGFEGADMQGLVRTREDASVNYQIEFNEPSHLSLENLIIMGSLPQVSDYGLVTLEERQSKFDLTLTGPIEFKNQSDKFDVFYSKESQIQTVGILDQYTKYTEGFERLKNKESAVEANWIEEEAVSDWSEIESFKVVQKKSTVVDTLELKVIVPLKTPEKLSSELKDITIPANERAAYMNIVAASNNYMPIENLKTGVFIDSGRADDRAEDITVRYHDTSGKAIAEELVLIGSIGETYQTTSKDISGYTLKEVQGAERGFFSEIAQTVTYVYTKNTTVGKEAADVTVRYHDTSGNTLEKEEVLSGKIGETYQTVKKNISGYILKEVQGSETGVFTAKAQTITYVYIKEIPTGQTIGEVTARYQDSSGETLAEEVLLSGFVGETYQTSAKEIAGYTLKEVQGSETGMFSEIVQTVIYIYTKDAPVVKEAGDVTIRYQDSSGKSLTSNVVLSGTIGETYQTTSKDIPGYTLKEVQGSETGTFTATAQTVTYIYTQETEPSKGAGDVTVRYHDTSGKALEKEVILSGAIDEAYETVEKTIVGYTLKEVQGSKVGTFSSKAQTVTYIYTKDTVKDTVKDEPNNKKPTKRPSTGSTSGRLPQTNEAKESFLIVAGLLMLAFVFFTRIKWKKDQKEG